MLLLREKKSIFCVKKKTAYYMVIQLLVRFIPDSQVDKMYAL